MSDIEGKVAREVMSECGQRASFNPFGVTAEILAVHPCFAFDGLIETNPSFQSRVAIHEQTRLHDR